MSKSNYTLEIIDKVGNIAKDNGYTVKSIESANHTESVYLTLHKQGRLIIKVRCSKHAPNPSFIDFCDIFVFGFNTFSLEKRLKAKEEVIEEPVYRALNQQDFIKWVESEGIEINRDILVNKWRARTNKIKPKIVKEFFKACGGRIKTGTEKIVKIS